MDRCPDPLNGNIFISRSGVPTPHGAENDHEGGGDWSIRFHRAASGRSSSGERAPGPSGASKGDRHRCDSEPVVISARESVSVNELVDLIEEIAGVDFHRRYVSDPGAASAIQELDHDVSRRRCRSCRLP